MEAEALTGFWPFDADPVRGRDGVGPVRAYRYALRGKKDPLKIFARTGRDNPGEGRRERRKPEAP
jgi:hypothetical protein